MGKKLLVVENQGGADKCLYDQFFKEVGTDEASIHVLWMSDNDYDGFLKSFVGIKTEIAVTFAGKSLQREMRTHAGELSKWASQTLDNFVDISELWRSRLFEFHFNHWLWQYLVRFDIFVNHLEQGGYDSCYVIGHKDFVAICQDYCKNKRLPFIGIVSNPSPSLLHILFAQLGNWVRNLASEIWGWWLTRNISSSVEAASWIYAPYPRNWRRSGGKTSLRFAGLLSSSKSPRKTLAYLISLTHVSERRLKNMPQIARDFKALDDEKINMQCALVESFGSFRAIVDSYFRFSVGFRWLKRWRSLTREGKVSWYGADLSRCLFGPILSAVLVDWPKNRYLENCVENALKEKGAQSLLVPIFELVEGRSVVRAGKRAGAKVVGIQHGAIGLAHRWRVVLPQGLMKRHGGEEYQPDIIAVEGEVARDWLIEAGIEDDRVVVVGAPRVTSDVPLANLKEMSRTILVLGEYHRPEVLFDWCAKHLLNAGYEVVLRPHPAHYKKAEEWLGEKDEEMRDSIRMSPLGGGLAEDLLRLKPVCVLASVTGAMVEVALSGWPVGVILSNWLPDYAPLTAIEGTEVFSSNDPGEVKAWIERLLDDAAYRTAYSRLCQDVAGKHIAMTRKEAAFALAKTL